MKHINYSNQVSPTEFLKSKTAWQSIVIGLIYTSLIFLFSISLRDLLRLSALGYNSRFNIPMYALEFSEIEVFWQNYLLSSIALFLGINRTIKSWYLFQTRKSIKKPDRSKLTNTQFLDTIFWFSLFCLGSSTYLYYLYIQTTMRLPYEAFQDLLFMDKYAYIVWLFVIYLFFGCLKIVFNLFQSKTISILSGIMVFVLSMFFASIELFPNNLIPKFNNSLHKYYQSQAERNIN